MSEIGSEQPPQDVVKAIPDESGSPNGSPVTPNNPAIIGAVVPPPPSNEESSYARPDPTPWWKTLFKFTEAVCAVLLVIITTHYTAAAYRQAGASEKAANAARDAVCDASRTLDETIRSNKAQETANRLAAQTTIDNFRLEQRAWVEFDTPESSPAPEMKIGNTFLYRLYFKNVGKTSARNISVQVNTVGGHPESTNDKKWISQYQLPNQIARQNEIAYIHSAFGPKMKAGVRYATPGVLAPGVRTIAPFDTYVTLPGSTGGPLNFTYFIGRVEYGDAFGGSHWMTFCLYVGLNHGDIESCRYGNDEDETSAKPPIPPPLPEPTPEAPCPVTKESDD